MKLLDFWTGFSVGMLFVACLWVMGYLDRFNAWLDRQIWRLAYKLAGGE